MCLTAVVIYDRRVLDCQSGARRDRSGPLHRLNRASDVPNYWLLTTIGVYRALDRIAVVGLIDRRSLAVSVLLGCGSGVLGCLDPRAFGARPWPPPFANPGSATVYRAKNVFTRLAITPPWHVLGAMRAVATV